MDQPSGSPPSGAQASGAPPVSLTREEISVKLREVALFQGLGQDDLTEILRISEGERVDAGEYVFEEGERGDHFFVIVHGVIELRKATGEGFKKLAVLRAGQAFGEMALLHGGPRTATCRAVTPCALYELRRADLDLVFEVLPEMRGALEQAIRAMEQRLGDYPFRNFSIAEVPMRFGMFGAASEQGFILVKPMFLRAPGGNLSQTGFGYIGKRQHGSA